jgi:putative endonuclease
MPYFVYILLCKNGSFYTGITTNVARRFKEHVSGKGGHYTAAYRPIKIMYSQAQPNRSAALKREAQIKSWKREEKMALWLS